MATIDRGEELFGGPLDGLRVHSRGAQEVVPGPETLKLYPQGTGSVYKRGKDGRLYHERCAWDGVK